MGNYPTVTSRVLENAAPVTPIASEAPPTFATISSEESLAALGPDWDAMVRVMPRPSPFLLHGWVTEWWRHYGDGCALAVQAAFRNGRLVAALPLISYRRHGLEVATFLGGRNSPLADVLLAEDEDPVIAARLVDRAVCSGQDYLDVFGLSEGCRLVQASRTRALHLFERIEAPVLDLSRGWSETYRSKTNSRQRHHHKHRRRQLEGLGKVEISLARTLPELEPALEDAFRLHALRWRGRPDGSGFVTPTGLRFNRAALRALAAADVARIITLKLDGRPIAFAWYIALEERMYLYRTAFDPSYARCSPGLVNTLNLLELASAEGLTRVEFLGGAERYKLQFSDHFEPLHIGLGLPGSKAGRAVVEARAGWLWLRDVAKRSSAARQLYARAAPARNRLRRAPDVLRPSGVARRGR
jgi:CelD/BcsL family acetyltransferase involved in cellulose biosynthesis